MLAGVSGIDVVLMVIAADEGIMPQTKEHLEILQLLNVNKGIIVLTKTDMVDPEWLDMVKEDLREELKDTFLENADIYPVSSKTKEGINELIKAIEDMTEHIETKDVQGHFRLPVDRVFSITGFGTVVTGTVISGCIKEGQTVQIYPSKVVTKVRGIQVHDEPTKIAEAGQRCAINLSNIKKTEIDRGDVVSIQNLMEPSMMIDCKLYYLKSASKPLENRQRVRLYNGTSEIICRVVILDKECLNPGEEGYAQLRLEKPITCQRNDRYVIRSYSPMFTIAGGSIIEPVAKKAKRFDDAYLEELKVKESGKSESILENTVKNLSGEYPNKDLILKTLGKNMENIEENLESLVEERKIVKLQALDNNLYIHNQYLKDKTSELEALLEEFHKKNPLKFGMSKEEIKTKIFGKNIKQKIYDEVLNILVERKKINLSEKFVAAYDFKIKFTKEQETMKEDIIKEFKESGFNPPKYADMAAKQKDKIGFKMVYEALLDQNILVKLNEECTLLKEDYEKAKELIKNYIIENKSIAAGSARELLDTNRKYAVAILEHLDSIKFTKRIENDRVLF